MKVVLVAQDVGPIGGMERQITELSRGLVDAGHDVTVVARRFEDADERVRWIRIPGPGRPQALAYPWFVLVATLRLLRERDAVVHSAGALLLRRADVITVHLCHTAVARRGPLHRGRRPGRLYRANAAVTAWMSRVLERVAYRPAKAGVLAGVSEGVPREVDEHFGRDNRVRTATVSNGVDADRFLPRPDARAAVRASVGLGDDERLAVFIGGEWEGKGLRHAVEALADAAGWSLLVVGDGDIDRYATVARTAGVAERVHFLGRRPDIEQFYAAADAFVLPSAYETFSLVAYEAAATGLPLVATNVSGVDQILDDGRTGFLVERSAASIAEALRRLDDDELRARLGAGARDAAAPYTWDRMVRGYLALYDQART